MFEAEGQARAVVVAGEAGLHEAGRLAKATLVEGVQVMVEGVQVMVEGCR